MQGSDVMGIQVTLRDGGKHTITDEQIELWQNLYPDVSVRDELMMLQKVWETEKRSRKTAGNINRHINQHLSML